MKRIFSGSILFAALILLSGLLALLFLNKESWLEKNKIMLFYTQSHLKQKIQLIEKVKSDPNKLCQQIKSTTVSFGHYHLHCEMHSIFIQPKPTRDKYIAFQDIHLLLDIESYDEQIYRIRKLSDLPKSSLDNPKVVIALNDIDETLQKDFYGIIITDYYFDIKGKKIYGALYSSYNNEREERNLTYRSKVIDNIEKNYSHWLYIPHSKRYAEISSTPSR